MNNRKGRLITMKRNYSQSVKDWHIRKVIISMKSRMKGDFHVRFCENEGVKFPRVTRLGARCGRQSDLRAKKSKTDKLFAL